MLPILKILGDGKNHERKEITNLLSSNNDLIQNDRPRRSHLMINAVLGYFKKAGIAELTAPKTFRISNRGKDLLRDKPKNITVELLRQFPEFDEFIKRRYKQVQKVEHKQIPVETIPEEAIDNAYEIHKQALADEIIDRIKQCSWQFFEILVTDLLVALGYGDPHEELHLKKGQADEGIDGIIKEDKLGLDIICLQAKKWEQTIGRPEVQKFAGSLESSRAKKGVFITTSSFSKEAKDYVDKIGKRIVLIDGRKLAELMIDYDIGVSKIQHYVLKKIDSDYFEEI